MTFFDLADHSPANAHLPTDAMFVDIFEGETLVAHAARARMFDRPHRGQWEVTLYTADRETFDRYWTRFPIGAAKRHARALRAGQAVLPAYAVVGTPTASYFVDIVNSDADAVTVDSMARIACSNRLVSRD